MWPWYGFWHPWAWRRHRMPYWYPYEWHPYPWRTMPKEQEIAILEEQEKWLRSELDEVRKRLEELRK